MCIRDSPDTVTLKLTITQGTQRDTLVSACATYTWPRNGQVYNTTGSYNYITTANGCPDTVTLKLTITQGTPRKNLLSARATNTCTRKGQAYNTTNSYN